MALAVPTHLENEADSASRRLNSLGRTRNKARRTSHGRPLRSGLLGPHYVTSREKVAYISLNTPTPCPPRGAVPVNRGKPCCVPGRISGKNSVRNVTRSMRCGRLGANSSATQSDLDRWCRSGRGVTDGREPDQQHPTPDFRNGGGAWLRFKSIQPSATE